MQSSTNSQELQQTLGHSVSFSYYFGIVKLSIAWHLSSFSSGFNHAEAWQKLQQTRLELDELQQNREHLR